MIRQSDLYEEDDKKIFQGDFPIFISVRAFVSGKFDFLFANRDTFFNQQFPARCADFAGNGLRWRS